jgi:DNA replication ATP-dependent helicase Dna2
LYQSLFRWVYDGDERKRRVFLGLIPPRFVSVAAVPPAYLDRPEQIEIFRKALAAQDYFLLQGPPGTGKTSRLLRALVDHLYRQTTQTLALLAYTNRAADEICEQLLELRLPFYRLGFCRMENVPTEKSLSRTLTPAQIHDFLLDTRIVVSTVASFVAKLNDWSFKKFDTAIIDEASQLLEPHVCGIWTRFSRLILIGDEKQLPAVVAQPEPGRQPPPALARALQTTGIDDLGRAVFDRMLERCKQNAWHEAYGMLTAQGRMHQDIARFVGERYYDGRLEVVSPRQTRPFDLHAAGSFLSRARVMFVNVPADKNAKLNVAEARLAAQMAAAFPGETGVISPFRAQIAEIVRRLPPHIRPRITVDTVERYQGSQRDFIVYSVCANYPEQLDVLSSLSDDGTVDRKLNVALTRAREQIVVLGNAEILSRSPHYAALIEYARSLGGYAEAAEWTEA